jgi:hypothetical protein
MNSNIPKKRKDINQEDGTADRHDNMGCFTSLNCSDKLFSVSLPLWMKGLPTFGMLIISLSPLFSFISVYINIKHGRFASVLMQGDFEDWITSRDQVYTSQNKRIRQVSNPRIGEEESMIQQHTPDCWDDSARWEAQPFSGSMKWTILRAL